MARHLLLYIFIFTTISSLLILVTNISCLPNIRILVNNENLQSPPYLLETIKQVEANESRSLQLEAEELAKARSNANKKQAIVPPTLISSINNNVSIEKPEVSNKIVSKLNGQEPASSRADPSNKPVAPSGSTPDSLLQPNADQNPLSSDGYSLVKEETVEEILDDQQDYQQPSSILSKLPLNDDLIVSGSDEGPGDNDNNNYGMSNVDNGNNKESDKFLSSKPLELIIPQQQKPQSRKPGHQSLPVTNAHLKKPANLINMNDNDNSNNNNSTNQQADAIQQKSGGAKSLITASVASSDEEEASTSFKEQNKMMTTGNNKNKFNVPPDTWEPSQIMQGVTNASLVPATVTKEYGQHSRTRITLGGGYVRDRQPPLVNPSSSDYNDDKPEKPAAPLESTGSKQTTSNNDKGEEISRVIEVPERIILPDSATLQKQQHQQNIKEEKKKSFKLDARCPSKGITTIEHPTACDRYFYCEDGFLSEETCPNGLMYGTRDTIRDYCVHRWKAVCDDKTIPNPISSPGCRWQFGIFNVQGSPKCSPDFYECADGLFQVKKCSIDGQVYDDRTKSCQFAEQIGCAKEALADFQCPPDDQANTYWPFPRYFLNERALIHCINDKPEIVRCTNDERVDPEHLHCVPLAKLLSGSVNLESRKIREKKKVERHYYYN